ncbi:Protoporphyrinogen oxidase [Chlamydia avium]|uniref:protoporphyrinogen oxidase n=1 Tax=Chlamydia avium TaxID=1457141 RepID=UPI00055765FE|nr:protoporphyrinogen oxidase [Chlamydia avium]VVT43103.1 Protoporphyrinogen oxidase [Chlamydia avium]
MRKILIIGAGISGLSTAWWLKQKFPNTECLILEKSPQPGGLLHTEYHDDFALDLGPKGFLTQGEGKYTLRLIQELGLYPLLVTSNKTAKTRFIHYKGKTRKISLWTLMKEGLPLAIVKDLFASRYYKDSSVREFLQRHSTKSLVHHIFNPIVLATRAGHSHLLSAHMAFPSLSQYEAQTGSLLRSYLKKSSTKIKQEPYLASLKPNFGVLIDTLVKKLSVTWRFSSPVTKIECSSSSVTISTEKETFSGDLAIYTGPLSLLPRLINIRGISHLAKKTISLDLSCITLGWKTQRPNLPKGYGMLFSDEPPLLGIIFNSQVFPEQLPEKTVLSLLLENRWHEEDAYAFSLAAISEYLHITHKPDVFSLFSPEEGLPQHCVGFLEMKNQILPYIPQNLKIVGQNFSGPGVNRCIASAYHTVAALCNEKTLTKGYCLH